MPDFDPVLQAKIDLALHAAQLGANGDMPPCAAAYRAVAHQLRMKAGDLARATDRIDAWNARERQLRFAADLEREAGRLEEEAKRCTATAPA